MRGRHRATGSRTRAVLALGGVLTALVAASLLWPQDGSSSSEAHDRDRPPVATDPTEPPSPGATTGAATATTPSASTSPSPAASAPPGLHEAPPRLLQVADLVEVHFDSASVQDAAPLRALSTPEVTRLEGRGLPGSPGTDTVVIAGEDRYDDPRGAFNRLPDVALGDEVLLESQVGVLTYRVVETVEVAAADVLDTPLVADEVPGRLVLVGLRFEPDGSRGDTDLLVVAELVTATTSP